jgi:hypothetical protein
VQDGAQRLAGEGFMGSTTWMRWMSLGLLALPLPLLAQDADELAKKLSNPVASLISVPFQFNYDDGFADGGSRTFVNLQPVVPISIGDDWNMISRTILPIDYHDDVPPGSGSTFGLGDTTQSLFFSHKEPSPVAGSGPSARHSCCPPPPMTCWAPASGRPVPPPVVLRQTQGRAGRTAS